MLLLARRPWWGDLRGLQRPRYEGYINIADYLAREASPDQTVLCMEIGVMGFAAPTRILDLARLVHADAKLGRIFNKPALVAEERPEWILETWPADPSNVDLREQAREGGFTMQFADGWGGLLTYRQVFQIEDGYGMRVLLRLAS